MIDLDTWAEAIARTVIRGDKPTANVVADTRVFLASLLTTLAAGVRNFSWVLPLEQTRQLSEATDDAVLGVLGQVADAIEAPTKPPMTERKKALREAAAIVRGFMPDGRIGATAHGSGRALVATQAEKAILALIEREE